MNGTTDIAALSHSVAVSGEYRRSLLVAIDGRCILPLEDGLGTYARNLLTHLQMTATDHRFLVMANPASLEEVRGLVVSDRMEIVPLDAPSMKLAQHWRVPRLLRVRRPDVYHYLAHDLPVERSVPSVLTFQDLNFLRFRDYYSNFGWLKRNYSALACARAVRAAHHILVPSRSTRALLLDRWPQLSTKVTVVPYGVHPRFRNPIDPARRQEVVARHGLRTFGYFLFVGTDRPHKNLARLSLAYLSLPREVRDRFRLALVGSHSYGCLSASEHTDQDSILRLGYVKSDDLPCLYSAAFAVVIPSLGEGFGLPALEAMSCGAPVLVSKGTALEEVAGETAPSFDPTSVDSIRSALLSQALSPEIREPLSRAVRERSACFDFVQTAERTVAIYEKVANDSSCPRELLHP